MRWHLVRRATAASVALCVVAVAIARSDLPHGLLQALLALGRLRPEAVGLALAFNLLSLVISGGLWSRLLLRLGHPLPARAGLSAFLSAGLAGTLVNVAGAALGSAVSLRKHGVCPTRAVLLSVMGNAVGFCGVLVWAPVGLLLLSRTGMDKALPLLGRSGPTVAAMALVGLSLSMLVVLRALASAPTTGSTLARRILGRHAPSAPLTGEGNHPLPPLRTRHLVTLVPLSAAAWFATTLALYVVLDALSPIDPSLTDVVGSTALAATLGSLAFFVPDGMGVRDGALIALLAHSTGIHVSTCTAAVLVMRGLDPLLKLSLLLALSSGIERTAIGRVLARGRRAPGMLTWWAFGRAPSLPHSRSWSVRLPGATEGE